MREQGVRIAEATVTPDRDNQLVLFIENNSFNPVKLKKEMLLGKVSSLTADPDLDDTGAAEADPVVAMVTKESGTDREEQVIKAVKVNASELSLQQLNQMQALLKEYIC